MNRKMIEGNQIYLKTMTYDDTDDIIRWRNKNSVRKYFIYQDDFTKESHEEWIRTKINTGQVIQMIIYVKEQERAIGSVYLQNIDRKNQKAEYGIFIGEDDARGHGYGTEAAFLILKYAFDILHLHKVYLRVLQDNICARKSYEKAGFVEEARLRDDIYMEGVYKTVIVMGKLAGEY